MSEGKMGIESEEFQNLLNDYRAALYVTDRKTAHDALVAYINSKLLEAKREGDAVAWMWSTPTNRGLTWTKCFPPEGENAISRPLFLSPQPREVVLPSLEEIEECLTSGFNCGASASGIANALFNMLKKNKDD